MIIISIIEILTNKKFDKPISKNNTNSSEFEQGSILDILSRRKVESPYERQLNQTLENIKNDGYDLSFEGLENIASTTPKPIIRSKKQTTEIDGSISKLEIRNNEIDQNIELWTLEELKTYMLETFNFELPNNFKFPKDGDFKFNKQAECTFDLIHISWDIETQKHQRLSVVGAYNFEAKRIVIAVFNEEDPQALLHKYTMIEDHECIIIEVTNPLSGLMVVNVETLLNANYHSALHQGAEKFHELIEKFLESNPFKVNLTILKQLLDRTHLSLYIAHNEKFDLNQIIYFNNKKLDFFNTLEREVVTVRVYGDKEEKRDEYKIPLGNTKVGFRIKLEHSTRFNRFWGMPKIFIYPTQKETYPFSYAVDTAVFADTQKRDKPLYLCHNCKLIETICECKIPNIQYYGSKSLMALSHPLKFNKFHELDNSEKVFHHSKFFDFTKPMFYLWMDLFSTLNVYEDLTHDIIFDELGEILNFKIPLEKYPICTKFYSSASETKYIMQHRLAEKLNIDIYSVINNIKQQSRSVEYFNKISVRTVSFENNIPEYHDKVAVNNYQGAKIENNYYGILRTEKGYSFLSKDFKSYYPSLLRLCNGERQLLLAANGDLDKVQLFGRKLGTQAQKKILKNLLSDLTLTIKHIKHCCETNELIQEEYFLSMNGVIRFTSEDEIYRRYKPITSKTTDDKRNEDQLATGIHDLPIPDFVNSIIELSRRNSWSIDVCMNAIEVLDINFIKFDDIQKPGEEMFTQYIMIRDDYDKDSTINKKLKFNANGGYGSTVEGNAKGYKGKFYLPSVGSITTSLGRLLKDLAQYHIEDYFKDKSKVTTGHTDSAYFYSRNENIAEIGKCFDNICKLEFETKKGIGEAMMILGRGNYSMIGHDIDDPTKELFTMSLLGTGSYGYRVANVYEAITKDILKNRLEPMEAIKKHITKFPLSYQINVRKARNSKKGSALIKSLMNKTSKDPFTKFDYHDITIYCYKQDKTLLCTTNPKELIKGQFFDYVNLNLKNSIPKTFFAKDYRIAKKEHDFYNTLFDIRNEGMDWSIFDSKTSERKNFIKNWNHFFPNKQICIKTKTIEIDGYLDDPYRIEGILSDDIYTLKSIIEIYEEENNLRNQTQHFNINKFTLTNFSAYDTEEIVNFIISKNILDHDENEFLQMLVTTRKYAQKHLQKRFIIDENKIHKRFKKERDFSEPNKLKIKSGFKYEDPPLPITYDTTEYECDGYNLYAFTKLNEYGYSSKMYADLNRIYSQVIINTFSRNASVNWGKTHGKDEETCNSYLRTDKTNLPCYVKTKFCNIFLKFRMVPKIDYENLVVPINDIRYNDLIINKKSFDDYLLDKNIISYKDNQYFKINKLSELETLIEKHISKHERNFMLVDMLDRQWSVEIVNTKTKDKSINYNAKLTVKLVVERNKMFFANLHINPASDKMVNFKTFNVSRQNLKDNSVIIRKILDKFLEKTEWLMQFNRKSQVIMEGVEEPDWMDMANFTAAYLTLKHKVKTAVTDLKEFHITTDLKCKDSKTTIAILERWTEDFLEQIYRNQSSKDELELRNSYYFVKSGQNSGVALVNKLDRTASIIYAKTYNQIANKIKRVSRGSNLGVKEIEHLRTITKNGHNQIRVETQLKHQEAIDNFFAYNKHDIIVKVTELVIKEVDAIITQIEKETNSPKEFRNKLATETIRLMRIPKPEIVHSLESYKLLIMEEIKLFNRFRIDERPPPNNK